MRGNGTECVIPSENANEIKEAREAGRWLCRTRSCAWHEGRKVAYGRTGVMAYGVGAYQSSNLSGVGGTQGGHA